jgi:hypothetical protein
MNIRLKARLIRKAWSWNTAGYSGIQVVLVLHDLVLRDFALTRLENLHHFSNLRDNFRFNTIWHTRSVVALIEFT